MNVTSLKTTRPAGRPIQNSSMFRAKWDRIVQRSVSKIIAVEGNRSGAIKNGLSGNSNQAVLGNGVLRTAKPTVSIGAGAMSGIVNRSLASNRNCAIAPPIPNLWVQNGVIWQLPSLLVGFTNYSAATSFFNSLKGSGMSAAPSNWYQGIPFTASDFPILTDGYQYTTVQTIQAPSWAPGCTQLQTYWSDTHLLIWARISALQNVKLFMSMSPGRPFTPFQGSASSAGPIFPVASLQSFSAQSPSGTQNFQAQYVMYVPGGIKPSSSTGGINYDMSQYCWSTSPQNQGSDLPNP